MRWGRRRTPEQLGYTTNDSKNQNGKLATNRTKDKHQKVKAMSDEELRRKLTRLQMEKQYNQLTSAEINRGRQYASKIVKAGTTVAAVTSTAITVYNNAEKISKIIEKHTQS